MAHGFAFGYSDTDRVDRAPGGGRGRGLVRGQRSTGAPQREKHIGAGQTPTSELETRNWKRLAVMLAVRCRLGTWIILAQIFLKSSGVSLYCWPTSLSARVASVCATHRRACSRVVSLSRNKL